MTASKAPVGLQARGRAFWKAISDAYDLSVPERELLLETCRTLDLVEALEKAVKAKAEPRVLAEIRQQRLCLGRLLAQLDIPTPEAVASPTSLRARKAARSRWAGHVVEGGVS